MGALVLLAGCDPSQTGLRLRIYSDVSGLDALRVVVEPVLDEGGVVMPFDGGTASVGLDQTFAARAGSAGGRFTRTDSARHRGRSVRGARSDRCARGSDPRDGADALLRARHHA